MTSNILTLSKLRDEQIAHAERLLKLAEQTGFMLQLRESWPDKREATYWPSGTFEQTVAWATAVYGEWCDLRRKRRFVVRAFASKREPGEPLLPALNHIWLTMPKVVALRALNAPLQVLSDGTIPHNNYGARSSKRMVHAVEYADRIEYVSQTAEGAQAMWTILLSQPVQKMLHHGDHYSRARRAGED